MLKVSRQGFHNYLANKHKPWKYEDLAEEMIKINSEDEYNDTYGRIRKHLTLLLKNTDNAKLNAKTVNEILK